MAPPEMSVLLDAELVMLEEVQVADLHQKKAKKWETASRWTWPHSVRSMTFPPLGSCTMR
jgi:hypothetical protein